MNVIETESLLEALQKGKRLTNPALWKRLQIFIVALMPMVPFLKMVLPSDFSDILNTGTLTALEAFFGAMVAFLTTMTTGELGTKPKR
jgi:hypothetical protein